MSTSWLQYVGTARDKRIQRAKDAVDAEEDCRNHCRYLLDLVDFMMASQQRKSNGLN